MKVRNVRVLALLLLSPATLFVGCRHPTGPGTVLVTENFDNENEGKGTFSWTNFRDWTVSDGCVDLHGNGFFDLAPGRGLFVDLDGSCKQGGTLQTKDALDFRPGRYVLDFWLAGNQRNSTLDTLDVSVGPLYQRRFILPASEPFTLYSETLSVANRTRARVVFKHHGGDDHGILLDLIEVVQIE